MKEFNLSIIIFFILISTALASDKVDLNKNIEIRGETGKFDIANGMVVTDLNARIIEFDESGIQIEVEPTIALDSTEVTVKITRERPTKIKVKIRAKVMGGSGLCIIIFMLLIL